MLTPRACLWLVASVISGCSLPGYEVGELETHSFSIGPGKDGKTDFTLYCPVGSLVVSSHDGPDTAAEYLTNSPDLMPELLREVGENGTRTALSPLGDPGVHLSWSEEITSEWQVELSEQTSCAMDIDFGMGDVLVDTSLAPVHSLALDLGLGTAELRFPELNATDMDELNINVGLGEIRVLGLGNSQARDVEVEVGMGSLVLDLSGAWELGAEVSARVGLGDLTVLVPPHAAVIIEDVDVGLGDDSIALRLSHGNYVSKSYDEEHPCIIRLRLEVAVGDIQVKEKPADDLFARF